LRILLGDNPFFGVDHLSQERARQRKATLRGFEGAVEVMKHVSQLGVNGFVVSTHPQLKHLLNYMKEKTDLLEKMEFYPILPYAQGYVAKATEMGMMGALNDVLSSGSMQHKFKILFRGALGIVKKDMGKLLQTLIDVELLNIHHVKKRALFLHNVITDLAIGLGMREIIEMFIDQIKNEYKVEPGFVTINFPKLINTFKEWNLPKPLVMTPFNPIGYMMNPSREECEKQLNAGKVIAMNVLAGGFLKPAQSVPYISQLGIDSVVIGMSSKEHATETILAFRA